MKTNKNSHKLLIAFIAFMVLILTAAGCSPSTQQGDQPFKTTIMLDWAPNTNHTGLYTALEKGFFADENLDVTIISPSSQGTLEQLVASGKADFGISHQEQVTTARINDLPIVSLAALIQHNTSGFASLKSKNIKTAIDFENKVYGGWDLPSETAILTALMRNEGADFNKIKMVNIGEADQLAALGKDIDLTWIFYGWTGIQAEIRGQELNMIWLKDVDPALDYYTPVFITNEKMIQAKPEIVRRIMKAVSAGYEYAIAHPEEAAAILIKHAPESDPEMIKRSQRWLSPQYKADASRWGEQKQEVWENYARFLYDNGLIPKKLDSSKAFTNDFLPEN